MPEEVWTAPPDAVWEEVEPGSARLREVENASEAKLKAGSSVDTSVTYVQHATRRDIPSDIHEVYDNSRSCSLESMSFTP